MVYTINFLRTLLIQRKHSLFIHIYSIEYVTTVRINRASMSLDYFAY